jgi:hypothetical protein
MNISLLEAKCAPKMNFEYCNLCLLKFPRSQAVKISVCGITWKRQCTNTKQNPEINYFVEYWMLMRCIGDSGDFIRTALSIRRWVIKHIQAEGGHCRLQIKCIEQFENVIMSTAY